MIIIYKDAIGQGQRFLNSKNRWTEVIVLLMRSVMIILLPKTDE